MFKHVGQFQFAPGVDEDKLMEAALEAGADDVVQDEEGGFEVLCDPFAYSGVKEALEKAGFKAEVSEVIMKPDNETVLTGEDAAKMQKILDALENLDDVQDVYTNAVIDE
jgi:transcriptional/translational regulatory protein YebC/TACO1